MTDLEWTTPPPDATRPEREPRRHVHKYGDAFTNDVYEADDLGYVVLPDGQTIAVGRGHTLTVPRRTPGVLACLRCGRTRDENAARRGRQSRNYGNRSELDAARKYGGRKTGHAGGPADVTGQTRVLQVKTTRRAAPAMWRSEFAKLDTLAGGRLPVLLLRFIRPIGPDDYFVLRAADFIAWYGEDKP